jgi:hypothetical protein
MPGRFLDNGLSLVTGTKSYNQKRKVVRVRAGGTIEPGYPVRFAYTTAGTIADVIACDSTNAVQMCGVYFGTGGSGTKTTTSGLTGRATAAGDVIEVLKRGFTNVRGRMTTTNANTLSTTNVGKIMGCQTVDYTFNLTAGTAGCPGNVRLSTAGAVTDGTTAEIVGVFVDCSGND